MAAPIGHIFLSLVMLSNQLSDKNQKAFIIGTSFPDIRHIAKIDRDKTHCAQVTLDQVKKAKTSFQAGYLFHSLVDELREKYLQKHNVYDIAPESKYTPFCLKLFEDQLLFQKIKNLAGIAYYFNSVEPEEYDFGISKKDIKKWHSFLKHYCNNQNTAKNLIAFYFYCANNYIPKIICKAIATAMTSLNIFPDSIKEIMKVMQEIQTNEKLKKILLDFYDNFDTIVTSEF